MDPFDFITNTPLDIWQHILRNLDVFEMLKMSLASKGLFGGNVWSLFKTIRLPVDRELPLSLLLLLHAHCKNVDEIVLFYANDGEDSNPYYPQLPVAQGLVALFHQIAPQIRSFTRYGTFCDLAELQIESHFDRKVLRSYRCFGEDAWHDASQLLEQRCFALQELVIHDRFLDEESDNIKDLFELVAQNSTSLERLVLRLADGGECPMRPLCPLIEGSKSTLSYLEIPFVPKEFSKFQEIIYAPSGSRLSESDNALLLELPTKCEEIFGIPAYKVRMVGLSFFELLLADEVFVPPEGFARLYTACHGAESDLGKFLALQHFMDAECYDSADALEHHRVMLHELAALSPHEASVDAADFDAVATSMFVRLERILCATNHDPSSPLYQAAAAQLKRCRHFEHTMIDSTLARAIFSDPEWCQKINFDINLPICSRSILFHVASDLDAFRGALSVKELDFAKKFKKDSTLFTQLLLEFADPYQPETPQLPLLAEALLLHRKKPEMEAYISIVLSSSAMRSIFAHTKLGDSWAKVVRYRTLISAPVVRFALANDLIERLEEMIRVSMGKQPIADALARFEAQVDFLLQECDENPMAEQSSDGPLDFPVLVQYAMKQDEAKPLLPETVWDSYFSHLS